MNEKALFRDIVIRFAEESHCLSWKVAAIAVKNGRIIGTGINGTLPKKENCDDYFWRYFTKNTSCDKNMFIEWIKTQEFRELHHKWALANEIHAEMNLVCECARNGISLEGCDIYTSVQPCGDCSKVLATVRPRAIYYVKKYDKTVPEVLKFIKNTGIIYEQI